MKYSKALTESIESAQLLASHFETDYLESWHLLIAMANNPYSVAGSVLNDYPLEIDDFGMERGTEYGLEQVYSVIDSRYRSGKPLIATTNLTLEELQHPQDTPHARIYDRLTSMCAPVRFTGSNFRKETAQEKLERLKQLMKQRKESL